MAVNRQMLISLIICTHDRPEDLRETLKSLSSVYLQAGCTGELILIDQSTPDRKSGVSSEEVVQSVRLAAPWKVHCLTESARGKNVALNRGLVHATGEFILFADEDVRFPESWIETMLQPMIVGRADAVGASVRLAGHLDHPWMTQWIKDYFGEIRHTAGLLERLIGPMMGLRREVLEKVPRFDTELGYGALGFFGETLFGDQIKEAGFRLEAVTDVVEQHVPANDLTRKGLLDRARGLGQSLAYICHHWEHQQISPGQLRLRLLNTALKLGAWRRRNRAMVSRFDRIDPAEMELVMWYHHYRYYLRERVRPRNYTRRGLVKIGT